LALVVSDNETGAVIFDIQGGVKRREGNVARQSKSGRTRLPDAVICPCLIGPKGLMRRSKLGAVGDTANTGSDKSSS
jgi:hypothetical protein